MSVTSCMGRSAGLPVPLASPMKKLPGGMSIKKSKIRGEISNGMLCSGKELGITQDSEGIYILPKETPLGRDVSEYMNLKNWQFQIEVMPNRPDLLGMIGIAREVGAITGMSLKLPQLPTDDSFKKDSSEGVKVEVVDCELCPRYSAAIVRGIKVGPSPDWLVRRLTGAGLRSINNIVDVTNFVMLEWGQPLHAFDLSKVRGGTIVVRRAKPQEALQTLDGENRKLDATDLAICDISKPLALAGMMGGMESQITNNTKDILLESACFDSRNIRKTSKRLGFSTDSSYRFERGVDPQGVRKALLRAASLIEEIAQGKRAKDVIDVYPKEVKEEKIILKTAKIKKVLGLDISAQKAKAILEGLGMKVAFYGDVDLEVKCPSFRLDIKEDIDLIEEVARIYGYHLIPTTLPQTLAEPEFFDDKDALVGKMQNVLTGCGFTQMRNYSFIPKPENSLFLSNAQIDGDTLKVLNPISEDMSVMRQSLLPSILKNASYHRSRYMDSLKIFEIDKTFHVLNGRCEERMSLAALATGRDYPGRWDYKGREVDFFDIKGLFEELSEKLGLNGLTIKKGSSQRYMQPKVSVDIFDSKGRVGNMGLLKSEILDRYCIPQAYVLELQLDEIIKEYKKSFNYLPYSKYPPVERDVSLILDLEVDHEAIISSIRGHKCDFLKDITVFDLYTGTQVPKGKKSLSYRLVYQSADRTLIEEEVNKVHDNIVNKLLLDVKAELRK